MKDWKAYRKEYARERYRTLKALGLCVKCGRDYARKGRVYCEACGKSAKPEPPEQREKRKTIYNIARWRKLKAKEKEGLKCHKP